MPSAECKRILSRLVADVPSFESVGWCSKCVLIPSTSGLLVQNANVVRCVISITRQCDARHSEVSSTKCSQSKGKKRLGPSDCGCQEPHRRTRAFNICFQGRQKGRRPVGRRFSNTELEHYQSVGRPSDYEGRGIHRVANPFALFFLIDESSRWNDTTAARQRRVASLAFRGGRPFALKLPFSMPPIASTPNASSARPPNQQRSQPRSGSTKRSTQMKKLTKFHDHWSQTR
jgi:hypothetical protein